MYILGSFLLLLLSKIVEFRAKVNLNPRSRRDNKFRNDGGFLAKSLNFHYWERIALDERIGTGKKEEGKWVSEFYYTRPVSPFLIDRIEAIRGSSLLAYGNNPLDSIVRWSEKAWSRGRGRGYGRISCVTGPRKGATYGSQIWPGILPNIDRV